MIRVFMLILRLVGAAAFLWLGLFGPLAGQGWRRGGGRCGWRRVEQAAWLLGEICSAPNPPSPGGVVGT